MHDASLLRLDGPVLQAVLDLLPGTLHVKDRSLRYCIVNRRYLERWGARAEDVIGRTSEEAFGNLFGPGPDERNRQVFATGKPLPFYKATYTDPRGEHVVLWSTKVPLLDGEGTVTHVLTFSLDITPLEETQAQLRESEQVRSAIVEHAREGFITATGAGRIVEFNPAAEQIFGYTRAQALGKPIGELLLAGESVRGADGPARSRAIFERSGERFETHGTCADGTEVPLEVSLVEIPLRDRRLFTACVRELTERQRVQAELERQRQALQRSERLSVLGTLAAGISHELRNPLSVVVSQAKLLEDELEDGKTRARLHAIVRAAEHCASVVSAFVDQSRQAPQRADDFALTGVVDAALALTAHVLREQGIAPSVEHADPECTVKGDAHQLTQVALNLLLNAAAAMQETSRPKRLAIATRPTGAGDMVELSVADSGPGIAPELRERIFERFFTTRAAGEGTGLGLAICRDIVASHGGHIEVERSELGGALFKVYLPLGRRGQPAPREDETTAAGTRQRVLVLDDETEIAELLREILELAGHEVDVAPSLEAALGCLGRTSYDAVLSDIRMPGMDGTVFYELLRERYPRLLPRIAFVTGDTLSPHVAAFLQRARVPHLEKPFVPRQVTELVARLAAQGREGRG